jgi:peroxiredoxin
LGGEPIELLGDEPRVGARIERSFSIPPARGATAPLTEKDVSQGLVILSTLPNIHRHACVAQIVDLEEALPRELPQARIVHVSADSREHWGEVDRYHPTVASASYTLASATSHSRQAFVETFGVAVEKHWRIAHGLFAINHGVIVMADIPTDQMQRPRVGRFVRALLATWRAAQ